MGNINAKDKGGLKPKKVKIGKPASRFRFSSMCQQDRNQEKDEEWLINLKDNCIQLKDKCSWAQQILYSLTKYEGYPISYYQREVSSARMQAGSIVNIKGTNKLGFHRNKKKDNQNNQEKYKRLMKQSDLIEEEVRGNFSLSGSLLAPNSSGSNRLFQSMNSSSVKSKESFNSVTSGASYLYPQLYFQKQDKDVVPQEQIDDLEKYVAQMEIISRHLKDVNNILGQLLLLFSEIFIFHYQNASSQLKNLRAERIKLKNKENGFNNINEGSSRQDYQQDRLTPEENDIKEKVFGDVKQFIRVMSETLVSFYNLGRDDEYIMNETNKPNLFNRENIINFITSQIFKNTQIYNILLELSKLEDLATESKLKRIMKSLHSKKPQDFYVTNKLCLNEKTLLHYNKNVQIFEEGIQQQILNYPSINSSARMIKKEGNILQQEEQDEDEDAEFELKGKAEEEGNKNQYSYNFNVNYLELSNESDNGGEEKTKKILDMKQQQNKIKEGTSPIKQKRPFVEQAVIDLIGVQVEAPGKSQQGTPMTRKDVDHYYSSSFDNQIEDMNDNNDTDFKLKKQGNPYSDVDAHYSRITEEVQEERESIETEEEDEQEEDEDQQNEEEGEEEQEQNKLEEQVVEKEEISEKHDIKVDSNKNENEKEVGNELTRKSILQAERQKGQKLIINKPSEEEEDDTPFVLDKQYLENLKKESYYQCMKYLLKMKNEQSPIGKMKMIVKASEYIHTCISTFNKKYGIIENACLDADDVLSLFSFFSSKCMFFDLNSDIKLISSFLTSNLLNSVSGYYLTTVAASLLNILEFPDEQDTSVLQSLKIQQ